MGYRGADSDITAEKNAKEELLKFEIISNQAQQGNVITDIEGNISYCNEAFATMHGYRSDELIGQNLRILHSKEQLDRSETDQSPDSVRNQEFKLVEFERKRKDGSTFPSLTSSKIIRDDSKKILFIAGIVIDITEKKTAGRKTTCHSQCYTGFDFHQ